MDATERFGVQIKTIVDVRVGEEKPVLRPDWLLAPTKQPILAYSSLTFM